MSILSHPQWTGPHNTNPEKNPEPVAGRYFSADGDTEPKATSRMRRRRSSVWREQVRSRLADLHVELESLPAAVMSDAWRTDARRRHHEATAIINRNPSLVSAWTGVDVEGTWMRIHAIEVA
ncbi:MAG: hypothetical protein JOZ00_02650, partial [Mycobacterium sp.]|nr:hypothetical protein [Mycobacterium sp.]